MADTAFHSPFAEHSACEHPSRDGQIQVRLHAQTLPSVTLISTWPSGTAALYDALAQEFGATDMFPLPSATGQSASCPLGLLLRTGPTEFLLIGETVADTVGALHLHANARVAQVQHGAQVGRNRAAQDAHGVCRRLANQQELRGACAHQKPQGAGRGLAGGGWKGKHVGGAQSLRQRVAQGGSAARPGADQGDAG